MPKSIIPPKNRRAVRRARRATTGAPFVIGNILYIQLGGTDQDYLNDWTRIERNIEADLKTQWPSENLVRVLGCAVWTGNASYPLYMDDLSFSNSMTTEHNVLGPGVIGHILRNRSTNPTTYAATDRWFHYDQVGSVLSESDNTGALAQTHWQDAFGNTLDTWQNGLIGGDRSVWHHNSKEYEGDSQLVYSFSRWQNTETASFLSRAPYPPSMKSPYSFASHNPVSVIDPSGELPFPTCPVDGVALLTTDDLHDVAECQKKWARSNPFNKNGQPHQEKAWSMAYHGMPHFTFVILREAWENSQGVGSVITGNDYFDDDSGRNADGSDRTRTGFQDGDMKANDEGFWRGAEDRKKRKKCEDDCLDRKKKQKNA